MIYDSCALLSCFHFVSLCLCGIFIPREPITMEKLAQTDYQIEEILRRRWSPRAFSDRLVEPEKMQSLFEAARWAPSSFNEQPWNFIVATKQKPEEHARLLSCLVEGNQR